jgi:hypothetical protein
MLLGLGTALVYPTPKVIYSASALCNLCVLCASAVVFSNKYVNHRDTEHREERLYRLLGQSRSGLIPAIRLTIVKRVSYHI